MQVKTFTIANELGFHARPAAELVKTAASFKSELSITFNEKKKNAKSIIDVLSLGIVDGGVFDIQINGEDEIEAMIAVSKCIEKLNN